MFRRSHADIDNIVKFVILNRYGGGCYSVRHGLEREKNLASSVLDFEIVKSP